MIIINDLISGTENSAKARFLLDRKIKIVQIEENQFQLTLPNSKNIFINIKKGKGNIITWKHANLFGVLWDTKCIEVKLTDNKSSVEIKLLSKCKKK